MSLQRVAPVLVLLLVLSVTAMVLAAGRDDYVVTALAAAAYAAIIVAAALRVNVPAWKRPAEVSGDSVGLMRRNIRLAALVYSWGAAAMLAVYSLSGLEWRHGWQYGFAMALFAAALITYVWRLGERPAMPPLLLTVLHGAAAFSGLAFLIGSGKLATHKDDWVANDVFLFGGLAILAICIFTAITQVRIGKTQR